MAPLWLLVVLFCLSNVEAQPNPPSNLRVEYLKDSEFDAPILALDKEKPRFSWDLTHISRNHNQTAFEILVSNSTDFNFNFWSQTKQTDQNTFLVYGGIPLESETTYYWKVRWWDSDGIVSKYSKVATFDVAFLKSADWNLNVNWIGGYNLLRKSFYTLDEPIDRARIYVSGLGYYILYLNSENMMRETVLDPAFTDYLKRVCYSTYNVTEALKVNSKNVIALELGKGWWGMGYFGNVSLWLQMTIEYKSGYKQIITSDLSWKGNKSAWVYDNIYNGTTYDERLAISKWNTVEYDDGEWNNATTVVKPNGTLEAQPEPPIKIIQNLKPTKVTNPKEGVYIFDFGQNFSGWCKLKLPKLTENNIITLIHSEVLSAAGTIEVANLRTAVQTDKFISSGNNLTVEFEPAFTYHGFRFVQVEGLPMAPTLDSIIARVISTDIKNTSTISFSSELFNELQHNIYWTHVSNYMSIPTPCNQRDERVGWTADTHLSAETALWNFDVGSFYSKWLFDIQDNQKPNGAIWDVAPEPLHMGYGRLPGDPGWPAVYPMLTYWLWKFYGDTQVICNQYYGVKKWIDYLTPILEESGLAHIPIAYYGDWVPPPPAPKCHNSIVSAFFFVMNVKQLAELAQEIGKHQDAAYYFKLHDHLVDDFNNAFYQDEEYMYDIGVQSTYAFGLYLRAANRVDSSNVTNNLLNDIISFNNGFLTTGIYGTKYMFYHLAENGRIDTALKMINTANYPSYAWPIYQTIESSATTFWELWDTALEDGYMNSRNQMMFTGIGAWFYQYLAGIQQTQDSVGFKHLLIKPPPSRVLLYSSLNEVSASTAFANVTWQRIGGTQCVQSVETSEMVITCDDGTGSGGVIKQVTFASFGQPWGDCPYYYLNSSCHAENSKQIVEALCIGKSVCNINVTANLFSDSCDSTQLTFRYLFVQVECSKPTVYQMNVDVPVNSIADIHVSKLGLSNTVITESSTPIWKYGNYLPDNVIGILNAYDDEDSVVFTTGSGSFKFEVRGEEPIIICNQTVQNNIFNLTCPSTNQKITTVKWASYGRIVGKPQNCVGFTIGPAYCWAGSSIEMVEKECLFRNSCSIAVTNYNFGDPCPMYVKNLAVIATCSEN